MPAPIEYYFSCVSPWSYLGHAEFVAVAKRHARAIDYRPLPLGSLFPETGGLPLAKRHPVRQNYRLVELQRWRAKKGVPLHLHPKFWPFDPSLVDRIVIALTAEAAVEPFLPHVFAGIFAHELDMANEEVVATLLRENGLDAAKLIGAAKSDKVVAAYADNFAKGMTLGIFGAPSYVLDGEIFWGQDRIGFLDEALASGRQPYRAHA